MAFSLAFLDKLTGTTTGRPKTPAGPRPWSAGDLKDLKALVAKGSTLRTMSLKMGRSEAAIATKLKEEGLLPGKA